MAFGPGTHPFDEYEDGYPDVDMCAGVLPSESLWLVNENWALSGHRVYCNKSQVKGLVQLASSPLLLYIPGNFLSSAELAACRQNLIAAFRKNGIEVEAYHSEKENFKTPFTVTGGRLTPITALDLGLVLRDAGIPQVRLP